MLLVHDAVPGKLRTNLGHTGRFDQRVETLQFGQQQRVLRDDVIAAPQRIFSRTDLISDSYRRCGDAKRLQRLQRPADVDVGNGECLHPCHLAGDMHHTRPLLPTADQPQTDRASLRLAFPQVT